MPQQRVLDSLCADVLAATDDDVLEAAGNGQVAARVEPPQVAGAEVAVGIKGVSVERMVRVPGHHLRSPSADLALLPWPECLAIGVRHPQLHPRGRVTLG